VCSQANLNPTPGPYTPKWACEQSDELALECGLSPSRARVATYRKQKRPTSPVGAPPLAKRRSSSRVVKGYVLSDLSDAGSVFSCGGGEATDSDFKLSDTATGMTPPPPPSPHPLHPDPSPLNSGSKVVQSRPGDSATVAAVALAT